MNFHNNTKIRNKGKYTLQRFKNRLYNSLIFVPLILQKNSYNLKLYIYKLFLNIEIYENISIIYFYISG